MSLKRRVETDTLNIHNTIFCLGTNVSNTYTDTQDIGFVGKYYGGSTIEFTGLFRDASAAGTYKLFKGLRSGPVIGEGISLINTSGLGYTLADLDLQNIHAFGNAIVDGNLVVNGSFSAISSTVLNIENNLVIANNGLLAKDEHAGFVVNRDIGWIISDVPEEVGTASSTESTTTIRLAVSTPVRLANYYKNWIIRLSGNISGSFRVTASSSDDPPILTFSPAVLTATSTSTNYELFNQCLVGTLYDETENEIVFTHFARDEDIIDIGGLSNTNNGNFSNYTDFKCAKITALDGLNTTNIIASGNAAITGNMTISGNTTIGGYLNPVEFNDHFLQVNTVTDFNTFGFVGHRPLQDFSSITPKIDNVVLNVLYNSGDMAIAFEYINTADDYFNEWVIGNSINGEFRKVIHSVCDGIVHTCTLSQAFTVNITFTDHLSLYNNSHVGWVYTSEKGNALMSFPRAEQNISFDSPINGNIPEYDDFSCKKIRAETIDLTGMNAISYIGSIYLNSQTQVSAVTFTVSQIQSSAIIYLNPVIPTSYTLPLISGFSLGANKTHSITFINISTIAATLLPSSPNTIENLTTIPLSKKYTKIKLLVYDAASDWLIT